MNDIESGICPPSLPPRTFLLTPPPLPKTPQPTLFLVKENPVHLEKKPPDDVNANWGRRKVLESKLFPGFWKKPIRLSVSWFLEKNTLKVAGMESRVGIWNLVPTVWSRSGDGVPFLREGVLEVLSWVVNGCIGEIFTERWNVGILSEGCALKKAKIQGMKTIVLEALALHNTSGIGISTLGMRPSEKLSLYVTVLRRN